MSAFDDAAARIAARLHQRRNQAISDLGVLPIAQALLAIAEAINGLAAAIREGRA